MKDLIIVAHNMAVRKDDDKMILLSFDLDENNEASEATEGILSKVNNELANTIQDHFCINLAEYGVEVLQDDESFEMN